jgi:hypothetical protein
MNNALFSLRLHVAPNATPFELPRHLKMRSDTLARQEKKQEKSVMKIDHPLSILEHIANTMNWINKEIKTPTR